MKSIKPVLLAVTAALILKLFFFDFIIAQGFSMEPAFTNGTVLVINRIMYGIRLPWQKKYLIRWAQPKAGEVVVFYTPAGEIAVKRCIALLEGISTEGMSFIAGGDNRLVSYDSRSYGPVPVENIIGKVLGY